VVGAEELAEHLVVDLPAFHAVEQAQQPVQQALAATMQVEQERLQVDPAAVRCRGRDRGGPGPPPPGHHQDREQAKLWS